MSQKGTFIAFIEKGSHPPFPGRLVHTTFHQRHPLFLLRKRTIYSIPGTHQNAVTVRDRQQVDPPSPGRANKQLSVEVSSRTWLRS